MQKKLRKTKAIDTVRAARVIKTASVTGVTTRQVQRVIKGDQVNEKVLDVFMKIEEGENLLLEAVKNAAPFDN